VISLNGPNQPNISKEFAQSFRRICSDLLKSGYDAIQDAGDYDPSWDEDEFTRELILKMDQINESEFPYALSVHWDEKGKTKRNLRTDDHPLTAKRVDITLNQVTRSGTTEYWIECKRVHPDEARLIREYWTEGIERFVSGKYADQFPFAAMAGFVIHGTLTENAEALKNKGNELSSRINLIRTMELQRTTKGMRAYLTAHRRDGQMPNIEIDHYLLAFD